jgi:nicotinamide-nucleotide amidase
MSGRDAIHDDAADAASATAKPTGAARRADGTALPESGKAPPVSTSSSLQNEELIVHSNIARAADLILKNHWLLATAESCTGGLIAGACTEIAGSSAWFERGFVSYSNTAKTQMLGVPEALIAAHGAVSQPVARAMAEGAVANSGAQVSLSVTGIAGPGGGSEEKPVGTVWFGWNVNGCVETERRVFTGDRAAVRAATVAHACRGLVLLLQKTMDPLGTEFDR